MGPITMLGLILRASCRHKMCEISTGTALEAQGLPCTCSQAADRIAQHHWPQLPKDAWRAADVQHTSVASLLTGSGHCKNRGQLSGL